ncbi:hypothetical protein Btru_027678, partial [Bulinus truncatus]
MADSLELSTRRESEITEVLVSVNETNHTLSDMYDSYSYKVLIPAVWSVIVLIGVVGNIIVVFTMCKHGGRSMS